MTAARLHRVLPVDDLAGAVAFWTVALGAEPTTPRAPPVGGS